MPRNSTNGTFMNSASVMHTDYATLRPFLQDIYAKYLKKFASTVGSCNLGIEQKQILVYIGFMYVFAVFRDVQF